ncbi:MAG TPA: sigma-70 family RNA polymerase sigma factor [Gemmatimonadaceae bacterium]|nr:sigma-70 family RNA polymerase sigma factor [Gemmatimonadaceae bacterium]
MTVDETVDEKDWLAERFEENRAHLRAVAYRMLGSLSDAEDAVQESWLRLSRSDTCGVENLAGWLTTVVARVCLDMLRSRTSRGEVSLDAHAPEPGVGHGDGFDPEHEAVLADSVGLAMLVVLDTLDPAERVAFVLHDMFGVPFDRIASIVQRSPAAARQLASRARRRVRGGAAVPDADLARRREVVDAFLAAARDGDFDALIALLDPDVVLRADRVAAPVGVPREIHGAMAVATQAVKGGARAARPALVNGAVGAVVAPRGQLLMVLAFAIDHGRIVAIDAITDPARLRELSLAVLE